MHQQGMLIREGRNCRAPPGDATTRLGPPNAHGSKCRYRTAWLAGSGHGWQRAHSLVLLGMLADHVSDLSVGGARLADLNRLVQALQEDPATDRADRWCKARRAGNGHNQLCMQAAGVRTVNSHHSNRHGGHQHHLPARPTAASSITHFWPAGARCVPSRYSVFDLIFATPWLQSTNINPLRFAAAATCLLYVDMLTHLLGVQACGQW